MAKAKIIWCPKVWGNNQWAAHLNIRLKLEHAHRLRIQKEIGEIEKERMITQNDLECKKREFVKMSQENDDVKLDFDYKVSKYASEIQKVETKLEKTIVEIDDWFTIRKQCTLLEAICVRRALY